MPQIGNHMVYDRFAPGLYLFSSHRPGTTNRCRPHLTVSWSKLAHDLRLDGTNLRVPAFTVSRFNQHFINPEPLVIDTSRLPKGLYRITVIHHFQIEATYPDLDDCPAAIFMGPSLNSNLDFFIPEERPVECRSLIHLAFLDNRTKLLVPHVQEA